jgi:hypothetical protein
MRTERCLRYGVHANRAFQDSGGGFVAFVETREEWSFQACSENAAGNASSSISGVESFFLGWHMSQGLLRKLVGIEKEQL